MVRVGSIRNDLTRVAEASQAWHIGWNIHGDDILLFTQSATW